MERNLSSIAAMAGLLVLAQSIAMLMAVPFEEANLQVFEDPYDVANPLLYVGLILLVTIIILVMVKLRKRGVIKHIILVAFGLTILIVFYVMVLLLLSRLGMDMDSAATIGFIVGMVVAIVLTYLLYKRPEWYVVNFVGVCVAAAVTAILGISLAILPVFILLLVLAIYDAISVYKTKHMITLADAVTQERLPVLLVIPRTKGYSFLKQKSLKEQIDKKEKRDAMFMGLGDIVIPGVLVVSAFRWLPRGEGLVPFAYIFVAVFTLLGCLVGFFVLMRFVLKGNPQAGLPLLNGGAILGYIISYLVFYPGDFSFGFFQ
jgi:presenilin-like A22 family membrane protease